MLCIHHPRCPACPLIDKPYAEQLSFKDKVVFGDLKGHWRKPWGRLTSLLDPVRPSPHEAGYRSVAKFAVRKDASGRHTWGIFEEGSRDMVPTPECQVIIPEMRELLNKMAEVPARFPRGHVLFLSMRHAPDEKSVAVVVSHDGVPAEALKKWVGAWLPKNGPVCVYESKLGAKDKKRIIGSQTKHLLGDETLSWHALDHEFRVNPLGFFQANAAISDFMTQTVVALQRLSAKADGILLDLYGGFGAYSLPLCDEFSHVYIVDASSHGISAAREAKARLGIKNLTAAATTGEDFLKNRITDELRKKVTHVIVNPPRDGLSEKFVEAFGGAGLGALSNITYVSCHPGTLARDLGRLGDHFDFVVDMIQPFDMFPQTKHVETVVHLKAVRLRG